MAKILFRHKPIDPKPSSETCKYGERWRGALMYSTEKMLKDSSERTGACLKKAVEESSANLQRQVDNQVDTLKLLFYIQIIVNISMIWIYVTHKT